MKKLIIASAFLALSMTSRAEWVSGHFRSNGTYVAPYYRTPANDTPYDNLSYRGYPSQQPSYVSPRDHGFGFRSNSGLQTMPNTGSSYKTDTYRLNRTVR